MSVNPDGIPRYEQHEDETRERTPDEWMESCAHACACARLWRIFVGPLSLRPDSEAAATLDCGECMAFEY